MVAEVTAVTNYGLAPELGVKAIVVKALVNTQSDYITLSTATLYKGNCLGSVLFAVALRDTDGSLNASTFTAATITLTGSTTGAVSCLVIGTR